MHTHRHVKPDPPLDLADTSAARHARYSSPGWLDEACLTHSTDHVNNSFDLPFHKTKTQTIVFPPQTVEK